MKPRKIWMLLMGLLVPAATLTYGAEPDGAQEAAIAAIEKLGGRVKVSKNLDPGNVYAVYLDNNRVTDAALVHLTGLSSLLILELERSQVTDAGLVHLKGLVNLRALRLNDTEVTDAGLEHLKGLIDLEVLVLSDTQVTDAGVAKLQEALPNCKILR